MVTKKRPQSDQGVDFESLYNDLVKKVRAANSDKRDRLQSAIDDLDGVMVYVCEPDPPGCSGSPGTGTYEELAAQCQEWNSKKRTALKAIAGKLKKLFDKICEPDPPGCSE